MEELIEISSKYNKEYATLRAMYDISMYYGNTHDEAIQNIEEFLGRSV